MATSNVRFRIVGEDDASGAFFKVATASKETKKAFEGVGEAGTKISNIMTKAGAAGPALLAAGSALSSAAAGGVALAGAIGPGVIAGVAAYGSGMLALKTSTLAASFAFDGLSEAISGDAKAMAALTPQGRAMAKVLIGLKPQLQQVRSAVQDTFFAGLIPATKAMARTYFPELKVAASETGTAMGMVAVAGARIATSGPWKKDFGTVAHANAINIRNFGMAGISLADALRSLIATAAPVTTMFSSWAAGAANTVNKWIQMKRESGDLDKFWARAAKTGAILGHILGDLGGALVNIFRIGAQGAGKGMLTTVEQITKRFEEWTGSASGAAVIGKWFENGRKNLAAMSRLVGTVFGGMQTIGSGSLLAPLIDEVTKKVIPPLMQFLKNASASGALNALVDAVGQVVQVFADLSASDSSLKAFAITLKILAQSFEWIINTVPGASQVLGAFFVLLGANQAINMVGLGGAIRSMATAMMGLKDAALLTRIQLAALWVQEKVGAAVTKAVAAAQWLLNAAMDANPVMLVVIAVAALVAGLIIAYKKSETFRNIVNGAFHGVQAVASSVFGWIKGHWALLFAILGGPIGLATVVIIKNFDKIAAGIRVLGTWARWLWNNAFQPAIKFIVSGIAFLINIWGHMLSALGHVPGFGWAKTAGQAMQDAAEKANAIANAIQKIPTHKTSTVVLRTIHDVVHTTGGHVPAMDTGASGGAGRGHTLGSSTGGGAAAGRSPMVGSRGSAGRGDADLGTVAVDLKLDGKTMQKILLRLKRENGNLALGLA